MHNQFFSIILKKAKFKIKTKTATYFQINIRILQVVIYIIIHTCIMEKLFLAQFSLFSFPF